MVTKLELLSKNGDIKTLEKFKKQAIQNSRIYNAGYTDAWSRYSRVKISDFGDDGFSNKETIVWGYQLGQWYNQLDTVIDMINDRYC
jgi:hypothetical protein